MPTGSSEGQFSQFAAGQVAADGRYGRAGFAAAFVNILLLEFITGVLMLAWYLLPLVLIPVLIVDALMAFALTRGRGVVAQIGRGMLIGCISAPVTLAILLPAWIVARTLGAF